MKKLFIIILGIIFILGCGCASLGIKKEQPISIFPIIGDINFNYLNSRVFISRENLGTDRIATISIYPTKEIGFVRIITNKQFIVYSVQYLKNSKLFVYKEFKLDPKLGYLYKRDMAISKEEIKAITKKLKFLKGRVV